ncbi:hypothetical protein M231_03051 [Tremella mesenterica]|uniref:Uncharacterized protein n=1 Tax=Tremella mesenterica TaxID=5217 RepID=A0A4Q1BP78_TREME|nr:hypothetical protein M231_03051 [Tremella mesenterica]
MPIIWLITLIYDKRRARLAKKTSDQHPIHPPAPQSIQNDSENLQIQQSSPTSLTKQHSTLNDSSLFTSSTEQSPSKTFFHNDDLLERGPRTPSTFETSHQSGKVDFNIQPSSPSSSFVDTVKGDSSTTALILRS